MFHAHPGVHYRKQPGPAQLHRSFFSPFLHSLSRSVSLANKHTRTDIIYIYIYMHTTIQTHRSGKLLVQCSDTVLKHVTCISLIYNCFLCFARAIASVYDVFCWESDFAGRLWPRLTSKIGELPSQFDALVSEELRDACRAASEAKKGKPIYKINKDIHFQSSRTRK